MTDMYAQAFTLAPPCFMYFGSSMLFYDFHIVHLLADRTMLISYYQSKRPLSLKVRKLFASTLPVGLMQF